MGGFVSLKERIILLPEAKMDYSRKQIETFIELWNQGIHIGDIAERFWISQYEVALLIMHCELEGWIQSREGGLKGTLQRKSRYQKKKERAN